MYFMSKEGRQEMAKKGLEHINKNYSFDNFEKQWVSVFDDTVEQFGSYDNRKNYQGIRFTEIK